ncbi:hypothetical protein QUA13_11485 [Microcoleus sp. S28C3]|uniref:hypothetical protein n=1 Tax=Microcoleus sp. S28C3 TaxID=3055414 RepID=UPI002FD56660
MNGVEFFKRSLGKWEGRRWYVYDNGDKVVRYTQFSNEMISSEKFLFPEGISVHHNFKVWNVTERKLENEMATVLHACPEYIVREVGYLGEESIECPITSIGNDMCRMITKYKNGWTHMEFFHFLGTEVRARNIRYDGIDCSGTFLENRVNEFPELTLENLVNICLNEGRRE